MSHPATDASAESTAPETASTPAPGGGAGGEPTPAAAEPTGTAAPTGGEPTGGGGESQMLTPEDYAWDEWDGSTYDDFPEEVQPWLTQAGGYFDKRLTAKERELNQTKALYEAFTNGYEDPRIAEFNEKFQTLEQEKGLLEQKLKNIEAQREKEYEEQDARYLKWYEQNYADKAEKFKAQFEDPKQVMLDLLEAGYELHIATEVGLYGEKAVQDALELAGKLNDTELALEILGARYQMNAPQGSPGAQEMPKPQPVEKPKPKVSPSDDLVSGAERSVTPKQVGAARPRYSKTGNAQRDRILSIVNKHVR